MPPSRAAHPRRMRRGIALVEVDGAVRAMVFLTNNLAWAALLAYVLPRDQALVARWLKLDLPATARRGIAAAHTARENMG